LKLSESQEAILFFLARPLMLEQIFPGRSEMARRMRALDWSHTPLGPVERWPSALLTSVSTCLDCAFPIVLWWGPELAILYNDEYRQILGPAKHPAALGQPGAQVWAEIWDVIGPMLAEVRERAEPTRSRDLLLHIDRGYPEEAYFSFSYSPIHNADGTVGGIFCPVIETTEKIIGERRLRTLRDLAAKCKGAESEEAAYDAAAAILAANPYDVPFALVYRIDDEQATATLKAAAGIAAGTAASPVRLELDAGDPGVWALGDVARSGRLAVVDDLGRFDALPSGAWKAAPASAIVLPVLLPGQEHPRAILVAAVSPMRALDDDYRTFFGLVATQIASGLADAQAIEAERRRTEALAELDRAKTAFFSNVSHEFRTPLTLMLGPIEDLRTRAALPPDAAASLDVAHRNSLRLLKLVNTLLDFSRIEAGRIDASYEPTDLGALTAELAAIFRSAVEKAGLRLVVDCPALPEPVYVDRDLWEKIVLNLLSNAFKFTFDGGISVSLGWRGDRVELQVADTGVGIPDADVPRLFQRFHRVRRARARTHEGTGIGLALVQELARLHGGAVAVTSAEGRGTTFTVTVRTGTAHLPPERIATGRQLASTSVGANPYVEEALGWLPAGAAGRRDDEGVVDLPGDVAADPESVAARILVADDNADMRDYLRRILGQYYVVEAVPDGAAALARLREDLPDLVLTDVMMPGMDGFALVSAIRDDAAVRSVPVIVLSARAGVEARIEGLHAGADDYVVKPFSARELLARVASQLQLARQRRQSEQALRYRSEQHETLLNRAPLGVYLVDADFRIREINPVALAIFGTVPEGLVGRDFGEVARGIWEPDYADEVVRIFRATLATGDPYVAVERAPLRIDRGAVEYVEWRVDRITLPEGRYGLVCYVRDISAQVQARERIAESERRLREADRRKDEFLALLAHELRNPLAPIRTGLELIRLSGDSPDAVRRVRSMMERQVGQMVRLIDDLLDVSRITSGKIVLQPAPTALADLLQAAIDAQRAAFEAAQIALEANLPERSVVVNGDATRLVQVFSNVLHNASKFTPPGGTVRVTTAPGPGEGGTDAIAIAIADSGAGMPPELLPRVFDLFTQGEAATERAHGGLGIGLALARRLVEMHGGRIAAASEGPGAGSTFTITLPLCQDAATAPPGARVAPPRITSRVVIVDDNRDAARTLSMLVEELGGSARTAGDAAGGLAAVEEFEPDLVFLDIGLPGMDGYEVCRLIRQRKTARPLLVVAVTGWGQSHDKRRAREAGFDAHLTKPVDPAALEQLLAGTPAR
jgi:PAS domain S-box-containing protein